MVVPVGREVNTDTSSALVSTVVHEDLLEDHRTPFPVIFSVPSNAIVSTLAIVEETNEGCWVATIALKSVWSLILSTVNLSELAI